MTITRPVRVTLVSFSVVLFLALTACGAESAPLTDSTAQPTDLPGGKPTSTVGPASTATPAAPTASLTPLPERPTPSPTVEPTNTPAVPAAGPTPVPTTPPQSPIARPDDTSTVLANYVEGVDGGVASLRFFETPYPTRPLAKRVYRTTFEPETARYIGWEIGLAYSASGETSNITMESEIRDAGGTLIAQAGIDQNGSNRTLQGDWKNSLHVSKSGADSPGFWSPGWYKATVSVGGREAARGWFQVAAPPPAESSAGVRALIEARPQLTNPTDRNNRRLLEVLSRLWDASPELGKELEGFSWTADGITDFEMGALEHLAEISMTSAQAADSVRSWRWLADGLSQNDWNALRDLVTLGHVNPKSLTAVAGYAWIADALSSDEHAVLGYLGLLEKAAGASGEISASPASLPWVADGVTTNERWSLSALSRLASVDANLGAEALAYPWVSDDMQEGERWALSALSAMTDASVPLARRAAGYLWLDDGITEIEWRALTSLADLAESRLSLASRVAGYSWLDDGLTEDKRWALWNLVEIGKRDPDLAVRLGSMEFMEAPFRIRDYYALSSIKKLRGLAKEWELLAAQDWFADGLSDEDAAFVATLADLNARFPAQYAGLVASHFARTSVVDLPLAGKVELLAFRRTPFQRFDDITSQVEDAIKATESFMGVPFPKKDVILLFTDKLYSGPGLNDIILAYNVGTHMLVTRQELIEGDYRAAVAHEVAHYYWHTNNAPLWFREGGSDFLADYILDWSDLRPLKDRKTTLWSNEVAGICAGRGVSNVQRLITLLDEQGYAAHADSPSFLCNYIVGEYLLLELYDVVGAEGASGAWGDLYRLAEAESREPTEQEIFEAFSRHTPSGQEQAFLSVYRRWHGGPAGG